MRLAARNACSEAQALHRTRTDDPFLTMEAEAVHTRARQGTPDPEVAAHATNPDGLKGTPGNLRPAADGRGTDALRRARRAYWRHIRRENGEICHRCGRPVAVWWSTDDEIWLSVVGHLDGVLCIPCFDAEMRDVGTPVRWEAHRAD